MGSSAPRTGSADAQHPARQIWKAVIALDLVKRRAIRAAERLLPGADLKAVLADPFMMEVRPPGTPYCL